MAKHITSDRLLAYEEGEMDEEQVIQLFQDLVDTGIAWRLQGSYGREAARLIQQGLIDPGHGQNVEAN